MGRTEAFGKGHGKANPLEINIPAPKGGKFTPVSELGERPELPHKEHEGAYEEYAPRQLSDQQIAENNHVKKQQDNWDKHQELERQSKMEERKASTSEFNEEELSPAAKAFLGKSDEEAAQGISLKNIHAHLTEQHKLIELHAEKQHDVIKSSSIAAADYMNRTTELELKHKADRANGRVPDPEEVDEASNNRTVVGALTKFKTAHLRAMNKAATIKSYLDKAKSSINQSKTADAADMLNAANKEVSQVARHLGASHTQLAYEHADVYLPKPVPGEQIGSDIARPRGPEGEPPKIKIGKPGRLEGDPGTVRTVPASKETLAELRAKHGTRHPDYIAVKQAHDKWKRGNPSAPSIPSIATGERAPKIDKDSEAILENLRQGSPEGREQAQKMFIYHAKIANAAIASGRPVPKESADHLGPEQVEKLRKRHEG